MRQKSGRRSRTATVAVVLVLVVLAGATVARVMKKPKPIPEERIVKVEKGDIARSVVARGKIEPLTKVEVKSKANGIIKALLVDVGDAVTEGQVLAELDKAELEAQVREAKAMLAGGQANEQAAIAVEARARIEATNPELDFARRDYERSQELFRQKIASQQALDDSGRAYEIIKNRQQLLNAAVETARAQVAQARAQVAAATAALDRAQESLSYTTIRSPIAGIVLARNTEIGDAVSSILNLGSAATLMMTLGDIRTVYIKGEVDEADIAKAEPRQIVRTKVESFPTESFDGVVTRIAPMGREQNNVTTFEVRVSIANPQGKLRANMTANAEIILEERQQVLLVPEAALVFDKDKSPTVHVLDASTTTGWRPMAIKTGISNGQRSEVREGLKEGDKVVLP